MQAARAYLRQHGANVDPKPLVDALEGVAHEFRDRGEVAGYGVDRMVDHVARQERSATWMPFSRPATPARLAPYFGTEGTNQFAVINDQKRYLRGWIGRQHVYTLARREIAASTRRSVRSRRAGLMAPLDFNAPTPEEKAEIRRRKAAITRRIKREVCAKYGIERLPKEGDRALVTGGQGTGKSRTTAQRIATLEGEAAIWWMVPTLEKAAEQAEEYTRARATDSMTARVVRGRGAPDPRTDGVEAMCPRHRRRDPRREHGCQRPESDLQRRVPASFLLRLPAPADRPSRQSVRPVPDGFRLSLAAVPSAPAGHRDRRRSP